MSGVGKKSLPRSWGWVREHRLGEQSKREVDSVGGERGVGTAPPAPSTRYILAAGPGLQPHLSKSPRDSPVWLQSTLSLFWSEK